VIDARQRQVLGLAGAVGGIAVATTGLTVGVTGVVDLLAGMIVGAASTAGLASMTAATRAAQPRLWGLLMMGLHLLKYPLILVVLYLLLVTLHRNALLLTGGYTLSLIVFLALVNFVPPGAEPAEPKA
jgi:hypothetical protein